MIPTNSRFSDTSNGQSRRVFKRTSLLLIAILVGASVLRLAWLRQESLWFDEVITMRLARSRGPQDLIRLLNQIDATRAPLHPLLLQGWLGVFGPADVSGRSFSVLCGVATVVLLFAIGRSVFDAETGLWAAWLCAWSPLLVMYSREARMYAWMVLLTSICWWLLFSFRNDAATWRRVLYVLALAALPLSHPLGILMGGALGFASFVDRSAYRLSVRRWLLLHGTAALLVAPWLSRYLDHPPSYIVGQLPIRFLFGLPIGFVGGDFRVLAVCLVVIAFGLWNDLRRDDSNGHASITRSLLIWFLMSPLLLYAYSWSTHPIFGPARYTLFVGPAYLLLLARGLATLPWKVRLTAAGFLLICAVSLLQTLVYARGLKADWQSAAAYLKQKDPNAAVVVLNAKIDASEYYLERNRRILSFSAKTNRLRKLLETEPSNVWYAHERPSGRTPTPLPSFLTKDTAQQSIVDFPGLRLIKPSPNASSPEFTE